MDKDTLARLKKHSHLCNIHFVYIDRDALGFLDVSQCKSGTPKINTWVWVYGSHGFEGVFNDGQIYGWDSSLAMLVKKIARDTSK